jgi:hypothetical protein
MHFSKIIIYTFINTILTKGRDDPTSQNDDRLSQISSVEDNKAHNQNNNCLPQTSSIPSSYPSNDLYSNSSLNSSYINYLGLLCIPIIMLF